jgi:hypothetical protein
VDDELSQRARLLIDHAMEVDVPPPSIADGSWEIVITRLTIEAARDAEAPELARRSLPPARNWIGIIVLALALAVAGVLLWLVLQPRAPLAPVPATSAPTPSAPAPRPTSAAPRSPAPTPESEAVDAAKLLEEAEAAEPARALELLARHAELAPLGEGTERRMALRISALCALGRTDDARADARAFLGQPRDPKWTRQVRASCAGR